MNKEKLTVLSDKIVLFLVIKMNQFYYEIRIKTDIFLSVEYALTKLFELECACTK